MWTSGWWIGSTELASACVTRLAPVAQRWHVVEPGAALPDDGPEVVVDASALGGPHVVDGPARLAVEVDPSIRRMVVLVTDAWLGIGADGADAAHQAGLVAQVRATALSYAASGPTVNAVALPSGFPRHDAGPRAVLDVVAGPDELVHTLSYFLDPANDYVVGQVVSLTGGSDVWGNHAV